MGGDRQQGASFCQGLCYQGELQALQVPQTPVDELAGSTRRACGDGAAFDQQYFVARGGQGVLAETRGIIRPGEFLTIVLEADVQ